MSTPNATTIAALGQPVVNPPFLAFLDFVGDPVRATTWETSLALSATGDLDLDGQTFVAVSPEFADVSPVTRATGGSDTVAVSLSGIVGPDSDLLDLLGDESRWHLRLARLWFMVVDQTGARIGGVCPYYTGRMLSFAIKGSDSSQQVEIKIESYLASLSDASNRTYLDQADFDPGDISASLSIAIANGAKAAPTMSGLMTGSAGGGVIGGSYLQNKLADY